MPKHRHYKQRNKIFKVKKSNENLGIVHVTKEFIDMERIKYHPDYIKTFFKEGIFLNSKKYASLPYGHPLVEWWKEKVEFFIRTVWLTKDYIEGNGFKYPIGVHWDNFKKAWYIHPGIGRQVVMYYFGPEQFDVLLFNTTGKPVEFKKIFNNCEEIEEYVNTTDVSVSMHIVEGHRIPSVHFHANQTPINAVKTHKKLKRFFSETEIIANFDLAEWGYDKDLLLKRITKRIYVNVDSHTTDNIVKAWMLLPNFEKFTGYGVTISDIPIDNKQ